MSALYYISTRRHGPADSRTHEVAAHVTGGIECDLSVPTTEGGVYTAAGVFYYYYDS